jgi:fatty acid desaturase
MLESLKARFGCGDPYAPPRERHHGRLFAHPEDLHCAVYNLLVLACYATAFWMWLHPRTAGLSGWPQRAAFVLGAGYLLGWISGVNVGVNFHNHAHRPIFRSTWLSRGFGHLWTFSGGWPAYYWYHAHVIVHHANLLHPERDWTLPKRRADGRFESIYSYVLLHWPWRYVPALYEHFRGRARWEQRRALKDGLIFAALWSIPWWIDPWMALCLWLFPQWVANAITMGSGMYVQHAGCVAKSKQQPYSHSTTFLSKFFNLTMFNIGYHIEHHDYPQVHWSLLPRFHELLRARLVARGAHVVSYGYYKASHLCTAPFATAAGYERFVTDQAPDYGRPALTAREGEGAAGVPRVEPEKSVASVEPFQLAETPELVEPVAAPESAESVRSVEAGH